MKKYKKNIILVARISLILIFILLINQMFFNNDEKNKTYKIYNQPKTQKKATYINNATKTIKVTFYKNDGGTATAAQTFTTRVKGNRFGYNTDGTPKWNQTGQFGGWNRTGYKLKGWAESPADAPIYSIYSSVSDSWIKSHEPSIKLYAIWEKNSSTTTTKTIKVTFHKNDGGTATTAQVFTLGVKGNRFGYKTDGTPKWNQTGQFGSWDRKGYKLLGWSSSPSSNTVDYSTYEYIDDNWIKTYEPNIDLYAVWEKKSSSTTTKKTVKVTFHKNDGGTATTAQIFTLGVKGNRFGYNTDGTPKWKQTGEFGTWKRSGYTLLGWSTNANDTIPLYAVYTEVNDDWINLNQSNVDLYCVWKQITSTTTQKTIKVNYYKNDGGTATTNQIFTAGEKGNRFGYKTDGTPRWKKTGQFGSWNRNGYTLLGWNENKNATTPTYDVYEYVSDEWINSFSTNSIKLYAIWKKNTAITTTNRVVKVTYDKNDGTNATTKQIFKIGVEGNKFGYNTDGTPKWKQTGQFGSWNRKGYTLLGWNTNKKATSPLYDIYADVTDEWIQSMTSNNITLYAIWKPQEIEVRFNLKEDAKITETSYAEFNYDWAISENGFLYFNRKLFTKSLSTSNKFRISDLLKYNNCQLSISKKTTEPNSEYKQEWCTKPNGEGNCYNSTSEYKATNLCSSSANKSCTVNLYIHWREYIDLALLTGQSNMVGYAGKSSNEKNNKNNPTGIDSEILKHYKTYAYTELTDMPEKVAYEYKYFNTGDKLFDISTTTEETRFGENISYSNGHIVEYQTGDVISLEKSKGTNMVPYFAKKYFEETNHKIAIVHASTTGRVIDAFLPGYRRSSDNKETFVSESIIEKFKSAEKYLKSKNYAIRNKFYVMYHGEADSGTEKYAKKYSRTYKKVHDYLKEKLGFSFGAIIHNVRYGDTAPEPVEAIGIVYEEKQKLIRENPDIILGTDFVYKEYGRGNKTIFIPYAENNKHLHSAALSQVGMETAINVAEEVKRIEKKKNK